MQNGKMSANQPLHAARIEDYSILANGETAALLSREGSIDWLCWPSFASGACFAALLGTVDHGFWKISPAESATKTSRKYRDRTLIVETTFVTADGSILLTDFMPPIDPKQSESGSSSIVRVIRGLTGTVQVQSTLAIRFDYGRTAPWVTREGNLLRAVAGSDMVILRSCGPNGATIPTQGEDTSTCAEFTLGPGETAWFTLTYCSFFDKLPDAVAIEPELARAEQLAKAWTAKNSYKGDYAEAVERSLLTLKALTYVPSGGIVAAPTASLPEKIGGERNWDYRYCWLRDTSFTLLVLLHAGYYDEAVAWRRWLLRAIAGSPHQLQTVYGICGERQLVEWKASWLPGYEHSTPVNFGNGAVDQFQLDVFGEVAAAFARMPEAEDDTRIPAGALQTSLTNYLCDVWQQPDEGIWETRGGRKHFTYSKVSAWVAVDQAIRLLEAAQQKSGVQDPDDFPGADLSRWRMVRDQIHTDVCSKGFNPHLNSFTQSYGSEELDASCLRILLVGFLPADDPRILGTVAAIEKNLLRNGFVMRYNTKSGQDGLPAGEGAFLACSFWLVINLYLIGRQPEAIALFERLIALRNDVGLLSEEWDPAAARMVGNFPQALSHIALCHAAYTLAGEWKPQGSKSSH